MWSEIERQKGIQLVVDLNDFLPQTQLTEHADIESGDENSQSEWFSPIRNTKNEFDNPTQAHMKEVINKEGCHQLEGKEVSRGRMGEM